MPKKIVKSADHELLPQITAIAGERATYGYRRVTACLNRDRLNAGLSSVNHKRIYRIMRQNQLLMAPYGRRPARVHDGKIIAIRSNMRWCSDGFTITCWNGDRVAVAFALDCHDREAMSYIASTKGVTGEMIRDLITDCLEFRFGSGQPAPKTIQWLTDNGPCYAAHDTVTFARSVNLDVCTTAPYSPESNGMAEAFVKTFKRDYVYVNEVPDAVTVLARLPEWFADYNEKAPHKGLGMKAPREYIRSSTAG
jgi:putative transposase